MGIAGQAPTATSWISSSQWVAANAEITLAWIGAGRGFEQASEVVEVDYAGVLVRDGYVVYEKAPG